MNIKKLARMSREEVPNRFLATLSSNWAKKQKLRNPVQYAEELYRWYLAIAVIVALFLLWATILVTCKPVPPILDDNISLGHIGFGLGSMLFCAVGMFFANSRRSKLGRNSAKSFIKALTSLENVVGKPLEQWTDEDDVHGKADSYLTRLASDLTAAEEAAKAKFTQRPWGPSWQELSSTERKEFKYYFGQFTPILDMPKQKQEYLVSISTLLEAL